MKFKVTILNFLLMLAIIGGIVNGIDAYTQDKHSEAMAWSLAVIWEGMAIVDEARIKELQEKSNK